MSRALFLVALVYTSTVVCQTGTPLKTRWWHDFDGTLGGTPVQLSVLVSDDGNATGSYCYREEEVKFALTGRQTNGILYLYQVTGTDTLSSITMREADPKSGKLEGAWRTAADAPPMTVYLNPVAVTAGLRRSPSESAKRYAGFSASDAEIESFMKTVRTSILNNDREAVVAAVKFPLKVNARGKTFIVKNRKRLLQQYDKIFTNEYKSALKNTCVCNLFTVHNRAVLAPGLIGISEYSPAGEKSRLGVTLISQY